MPFTNYHNTIFNHYWRKFLTVFALLVFTLSAAQDFKWVHIPEHLGSDPFWNGSAVGSVVADKDGNIYTTGYFRGDIDFDDGNGVEQITPPPYGTNFFILKLSKDKNIRWVKYFSEPGVSVHDVNITMDSDEKLVLSLRMNNLGFAGITFQPDEVFLNGTITGSQFGLLLRMDLEGNIEQNRFFDLYSFEHTIDSDNNIIVSGSRLYYDQFVNEFSELQVSKLDKQDFHTLWQTNINGSGYVFSNTIVANNQGDVFLSGSFRGQMNFNGQAHTSLTVNSSFICRFNNAGQEDWFKTSDIGMSLLTGDGQDNAYAVIYYDSPNVRFGNQVVTMPFLQMQEAALLKLNPNGDILWSKSVYGDETQHILDVVTNTHGELVLCVETTGVTYFDGQVITSNDENVTSLLKLDNSGGFIEMKEVILNTVSRDLALDNENNIIMCGSFTQIVDFDPHPVKQELRDAENYDELGFILKLSACDSDAPSGDTVQSFCSAQNPTIKSLKIDQVRVKWFDSLTSTTPLSENLPLQDGQKYYAARVKIPNCPEITTRLEVSVSITAEPAAPMINPIQPCYDPGLKLGDLDIQGQSLTFYTTATGFVRVNASALVVPGTIYYVTQKSNNCESPRASVSISGLSAVNPNDYSVYLCDDDKNNAVTVNLSNYNNFIVNNFSAQGILMSYHKSDKDAVQGINPILAYQNYLSGNEKIYVRVFSSLHSCYDVGILSIILSSPPEIVKLEVRDWADNNSITVLPLNTNHSYSLDGINFQDSNVFENLDPGEFEVFVKDKLGVCNPVSKKVFVLGYPKFFTPNGDGINDYWKIKFAVFQFVVDVEIYDRYGKLITGFDKMSIGWDGKLNGKNLPATDYWFRIIRVTNKEIIYRGHFSLVR